MLLLPGSLLAAAAVVLTVALLVVHTEQKHGQRSFWPQLRGWLDRRCDSLAMQMRQLVRVIVVSCMYVVHQLRATLARAIAPQPRKPRKQRDKLQFEKTNNHLSDMHDHKSDSALTPAQKKKLRNQKLEERF
jgi:hypothetical protein